MKKTPLKRNQKPLKKTSLNKVNPKKAKEKQEERKILHEKDTIFYNEIWRKRKAISDLTGKIIYQRLDLSFYIHHLLPKGQEKYKQFRHKSWNVILLEDFLHSQIEINPNKLPEEIYDKLKEFEKIAKQKAGI